VELCANERIAVGRFGGIIMFEPGGIGWRAAKIK